MARRGRRPAKKQKVKGLNSMHTQRDEGLQDWISQLPDEILLYILSLLTLKEAGRTCVLSHRWEKLWTLSPKLYFEEKKILDDIELGRKSLETERLRYKSWVNQVVKLYEGAAVDEFRIHFDLDRDSQRDIDRWVNFAIEKKVKRLEMDLSNYCDCPSATQYFFPDKQGKKELRSQIIGFPNCNSLTALFLKNVSVNGEVVEYFLSNCPFLERLYVESSDSLVSLQVTGLLLPLKYLEIHYCWSLKKVEIYAPNIISFKYFGEKINIPFKFTPTLRELSIGGDCSEYVVHDLCVPSSYLSQLETLSLDLPHKMKFECSEISVLTNLKQLELKVVVCADSLLSIIPLIEACPFLHSLSLEVDYWDCDVEQRARKPDKRPHQYLKVVEFAGFVGKAVEVEIAMYIIENAVMLDKIIFDTRNQALIGSPFESENPKKRRMGRKRAKLLRSKVRPEVHVVIL